MTSKRLLWVKLRPNALYRQKRANMECEQCGKEYESKRADSRYCGTKCRVTANRNKRNNVTDNAVPVVTDKLDYATIKAKDSLTDSAGRKYQSYSTNVSNDSLSGEELIFYLDHTPIDQLEEQGFWIPARKYAGKTYNPAEPMWGITKRH